MTDVLALQDLPNEAEEAAPPPHTGAGDPWSTYSIPEPWERRCVT